VQDVKVLRSIALLDQAAIDAVRQWVFSPTLLNTCRNRSSIPSPSRSSCTDLARFEFL
jgi:outer membrane biosynthesis protein TonB